MLCLRLTVSEGHEHPLVLYIACICLSDTTFCTNNLRGRFYNPSLCPFVRSSVRPSSVRPSVYPFIHLSVRLFGRIFLPVS